MRFDIAGLWWDDRPPPKPPKAEKPKRAPPEPTWLRPDYLPGLQEARTESRPIFTDAELVEAAANGDRLVWDIECYPNYFLVAFKSITSGKVIWFEAYPGHPLQVDKLKWILETFILIDYNGNRYDIPMATLAVAGHNTEYLQAASTQIIVENARPGDLLRKIPKLKVNHIDLIELVALSPSLKLLAGRVHAKRMQDLPFLPGTVLTQDQALVTRWYCFNDLDNTEAVYRELLPDIQLREKMSAVYGIDLRSHSDPQIAEAIISREIKRITKQQYLSRATVQPGTAFKYQTPGFIRFKTPLMQEVLQIVKDANFVVQLDGSAAMPPELKELQIPIGGGVYRMGIGGLHSSEKTIKHVADEETLLVDRDVASYYPKIILNCGLAPAHLGNHFLSVYNKLVNERLAAKHRKDKTAADGLKIVVNGSFGKLGNQYSFLYSPNLLIQVTVTGQLALLMLIETIELAGIPVISANTDGIVVKCPAARKAELDRYIQEWERATGFETEETQYLATYNRDVNNYFAVKKTWKDSQWLSIPSEVKVKGVYSEKGSSRNSILSKNPTTQICSDAVQALLLRGIPVEETINACRDIRKFVAVRTVRGGAVKDGEYLGKAIRWYYGAGTEGEIVYAKSGNQVPRSIGAKPLMQLPVVFPEDVNYDWYIKETQQILVNIGYLDGETNDTDEGSNDTKD